jgi:hypothetical protein
LQKPADNYTFFYAKGKDIHHSQIGIFYVRESAVKREEFVGEEYYI